jgi:sulfite reductase (NADPH) flavoprotein alpha-component
LPHNDPALADQILAALDFTGDEVVTAANKEEMPIRQALIETSVITEPDKKLLAAIAEKAGDAAGEWAPYLEKERKAELIDYLWGRDVLDFLNAHPEAKFEPAEFASLLRKLNVRLYSIASSLAAHADEVHLTVAVVRYASNGRQREGVCSSWLASRIDNETEIPCFITAGKGFRLPGPEQDTPIIMCGPGTGIAPFRAFLQERSATNAKGGAWLFFGEIHEETCYFYKDEWDAYIDDGALTKVTTAWSRDQGEKVYVQHRIMDEGPQFWDWLERGAIFYVCGDAARMAPDVDRALHHVIQNDGGKTEEEAAAYVEQMKEDKRYRRDVY